MTAKLTENEIYLLQLAGQKERGVAQYAKEKLAGKVIYKGDQGYSWDMSKRLWVPGKEASLALSFFNDLQGDIDNLIEKLESSGTKLVDYGQEKGRLKGMLESFSGISRMNPVWKFCTRLLQDNDVQLDRYNDFLPLKGGNKVNLRTGEITVRTSEDLWSYEIEATGTECSEQAKADNLRYFENLCRAADARNQELLADMSEAEKQAYELEPHPTVLDYFQRLLGYGLTYEIFDKAFYVFSGISDSGKSHVLERMSMIFSERIGSCPREVFIRNPNEGNHQTHLGALEGKSLVYVSELEQGKSLNAAQIKALTGGDKMSIRKAYAKENYDLQVFCKCVVGTNEMPKMNGGDSGLMTRLRKIPFMENQVKKDPVERLKNQQMLQRLETQDGINATFAWILEGAIKVFAELEQGRTRILPPHIVTCEGAEFLGDHDSFQHFLAERCEVWEEGKGERKDYTFERSQLQNMYAVFCGDFSYTGEEKLHKSTLVDRIKARFPGQKTRGAFIGLRPKPGSELEDPWGSK